MRLVGGFVLTPSPAMRDQTWSRGRLAFPIRNASGDPARDLDAAPPGQTSRRPRPTDPSTAIGVCDGAGPPDAPVQAPRVVVQTRYEEPGRTRNPRTQSRARDYKCGCLIAEVARTSRRWGEETGPCRDQRELLPDGCGKRKKKTRWDRGRSADSPMWGWVLWGTCFVRYLTSVWRMAVESRSELGEAWLSIPTRHGLVL